MDNSLVQLTVAIGIPLAELTVSDEYRLNVKTIETKELVDSYRERPVDVNNLSNKSFSSNC